MAPALSVWCLFAALAPASPWSHAPTRPRRPTLARQAADADDLLSAVGSGKGRHSREQRRQKRNKYGRDAARADPWDEQLQAAVRATAEQTAAHDAGVARDDRAPAAESGGPIWESGEFPREDEVDFYEPSSFGFTEVALVLGAHGMHGELKVRSESDFALQRLCTPGPCYVKRPTRRFPRERWLRCGRQQQADIFIVELDGLSSREEAAALKGCRVFVATKQRPELAEDEFLVTDLIGMRAVWAEDSTPEGGAAVGDEIGTVHRVVSTTADALAGDLIELMLPPTHASAPAHTVLVPFVPELVPLVDSEERVIHLRPPGGLLGLAVPYITKARIRGLLPGSSTP